MPARKIAILSYALLAASWAANAAAQSPACQRYGREAVTLRQQLSNLDGAIGRTRQEIEQLRKRMRQLERQLRDQQNNRAHLQSVLNQKQALLRDNCSRCGSLDKKLEDLTRRLSSVEHELFGLQKAVSAKEREVDELDRTAQSLERRYRSLHCGNLVPGHASQTTIDQCHRIFSEWNRVEARANQLQRDLDTLQRNYKQNIVVWMNLHRELNGLRADYDTYCKSSHRLKEVRGWYGKRRAFDGLEVNLDRTRARLLKVRRVRLKEVPARRHRLKKVH